MNGTSGIAGFAGIALGFASLAFLGTTAVYFFATLSIVIILPTTFFIARNSIPPPLRDARDFIGKEISIDNLEDFLERPTKIAFVGPANAGKSTLKSRILLSPHVATKTQALSARMVTLGKSNTECLILLDGAGDIYSQQFKLLELADIVCIVLDHHSRDDIVLIDQDRVIKNIDFVGQACAHLAEIAAPRKIFYVAINKRDLWEQEAPERKEWLLTVQPLPTPTRWRLENLASREVVVAAHSNNYPGDIAKLAEFLKNAF